MLLTTVTHRQTCYVFCIQIVIQYLTNCHPISEQIFLHFNSEQLSDIKLLVPTIFFFLCIVRNFRGENYLMTQNASAQTPTQRLLENRYRQFCSFRSRVACLSNFLPCLCVHVPQIVILKQLPFCPLISGIYILSDQTYVLLI